MLSAIAFSDLIFEECTHQRAVQSLRSRERRERTSWTKREISLILLTCRIIFILIFVHYSRFSITVGALVSLDKTRTM